jgi:hypothetical protein
MKKIAVLFVVLCVMFAVIGCGTKPAATGGTGTTNQSARVPGSFPDFVKNALMNVPEDVLVGIGVYSTGGQPSRLQHGMTIAQTRARADISRQLNTIVKDMITDYTAGSEADPSAVLSFQENITVALSKSELMGAIPKEMDEVDGKVWAIVWLEKSNAAANINQAQAAARLAVPAMAAFNAQDRMEAAFERQARQEYQANETGAE